MKVRIYSQEWENFKWLADTSVATFKNITTIAMALFMITLLVAVFGIISAAAMNIAYPHKQGVNDYATSDY